MAAYCVPFFSLDRNAHIVHGIINELRGGSGGLFQIAAPQINCQTLSQLKDLAKENKTFVEIRIDYYKHTVLHYYSQNGIFVLHYQENIPNPVGLVLDLSKFETWEDVLGRIENLQFGHGWVKFQMNSKNSAKTHLFMPDAKLYLTE